MYRVDGMVSKDFNYALAMDAESGLRLSVTVEENVHVMTDNPGDEMYYYDLFYGDKLAFDELMDQYRKGGME